jgi:hypothetical protein
MFDENQFQKFKTSTGIDGNFVGSYYDKVIRIIEANQSDYKELIIKADNIPFLIKSDIISEENDRLIVEHPQLKNITYQEEWTKKQKVSAAKSIITIQERLSSIGFYLNDPHAFNITFESSSPVYFDLGSIKKGMVSPWWWFLKCFTGWKEKDYWDSVLPIGRLKKLWITFGMFIRKEPYSYLKKRIEKSESSLLVRMISFLSSKYKLVSKSIDKLSPIFPRTFSRFTHWTGYKQYNIDDVAETDRVQNLEKLFISLSGTKIIDIGANRGAYTYLAFKHGFSEAICIDLDQHSLDSINKFSNENRLNIVTANIDIMNYSETPGYYNSYLPAHERLSAEFGICLAVVHHVCYFGNSSFDNFAERLNRFVSKTIIVEFVPYDDIHLTGPKYKSKDRSWYTLDNFIIAIQRYFPAKYEIYDSTPKPRVLVKFSK